MSCGFCKAVRFSDQMVCSNCRNSWDIGDPNPPACAGHVYNAQGPKTAADVLFEMANTYKERNKVYGDNYKMVAKLVAVLFPNGVPPELVVTDQWHLFELKLVKLSRFAISNLTHIDSIHDDSVYGAMIEAILHEGEVDE